MPIIASIPESYNDGFKALSSLKEDIFKGIQEALSSVEYCSSTSELAELVSKSKGLDSDYIEDIFTSVEGLFSFIEEENQIEEVSDDVASILIKGKIINEKEGVVLVQRLLTFLKDKKIYYASKASDLLRENRNYFIFSNVITDIRPVFDLDIEQAPKAGVLMHTLRIHYNPEETDEHKDFYITLEPSDIEALIDVLLTAGKKEESLQSIFKNSGMINLNG